VLDFFVYLYARMAHDQYSPTLFFERQRTVSFSSSCRKSYFGCFGCGRATSRALCRRAVALSSFASASAYFSFWTVRDAPSGKSRRGFMVDANRGLFRGRAGTTTSEKGFFESRHF
jgi:hypothetical protein